MKMTRILPALAAAAAALLFVLGITAYLWRSEGPQPFMIATANPYASEAGAQILRAGGSAVDAAIAVQAVLSLVEPESSGLAGGAFMLHFDSASGRLEAYDGRETAPAGATPQLFLDEEGKPLPFLEAMIGGSSVGTPGAVKMLWLAHGEHGVLPWADLFKPAIRLAEEGFAVPPKLAEAIARDPVLMNMPVAQDYFYRLNSDGSRVPAQQGDTLKNPAYAATLKLIASEGPDGFYSGPVAQAIVDAVQNAPARPGTLSLDDLASYEAKKREPVCAPYRAYRVCSMPPPTSGGLTALQILGILQNYDLNGMGPMTLTSVHFIAEAEKLAYADRDKYIGDPDFVDVPVEAMLDPGYLERRASEIDASMSMKKAKAGVLEDKRAMNRGLNHPIDKPSTTHFSILDSDGNAVSMTSSVEGPFGSHLMAAGMMLNNQLTDFSFVPEENGKPVANSVAPGKRPRSSMTPVIVFDAEGNFHAAIGSPGGSRIIGYVTQTLIALIDWDMDMTGAIGLPRFLDRNGPLEIEAGTPLEQMIPDLEALGHEVKAVPLMSGLHGILVTPSGLDGAADPRRDGNVVTGER
ncbi:gamma-glutamyltransferase [Parvibaculum sp.]|jgi:gamma-glutamyltranspeptidase/glutathione hydrolase|uniref:gamma-glutamyltransferase n=1 Tax=Parvibaculum sp. TaxID=2024848 RepID=UPI000C5CFE09|nr:gamma-glutamyltransferase [Parvibaculum sp.]MAU61696.1 gamma-glutamyltransferase [Parvibaculum sp.]MBO6666634.1 gamma-glutamyltransferase [Parvibaculum sp.]MBO6692517.1 gamma-glutamyltransferase [Parvibaculum sp.]MBO6713255.1 gamma-glutamyltransferase [Parvibaculum sp.]|tara:strand:+ start:549 stop:2282 length:1734 start_codon:yes stop_codon:yes gene_type:complete